jgi:hypothetical protein
MSLSVQVEVFHNERLPTSGIGRASLRIVALISWVSSLSHFSRPYPLIVTYVVLLLTSRIVTETSFRRILYVECSVSSLIERIVSIYRNRWILLCNSRNVHLCAQSRAICISPFLSLTTISPFPSSSQKVFSKMVASSVLGFPRIGACFQCLFRVIDVNKCTKSDRRVP